MKWYYKCCIIFLLMIIWTKQLIIVYIIIIWIRFYDYAMLKLNYCGFNTNQWLLPLICIKKKQKMTKKYGNLELCEKVIYAIEIVKVN